MTEYTSEYKGKISTTYHVEKKRGTGEKGGKY